MNLVFVSRHLIKSTSILQKDILSRVCQIKIGRYFISYCLQNGWEGKDIKMEKKVGGCRSGEMGRKTNNINLLPFIRAVGDVCVFSLMNAPHLSRLN